MTPALRSAATLLKEGRLQEARAALIKILRVRGSSVMALQLMGAVLSELGDHDQAVVFLKRATALDPDSASAHFNLGKAQHGAGHPETALHSLSRSLGLEPARAETHFAYGSALQDRRRFEEALVSYRRALAIDPDLVGAYVNTGTILFGQGATEAAEAAFDDLLKREPGAPDGLFWKAFCQQGVCDWTDYEARISRLVELVASGSIIRGFSIFLASVCEDNRVLRMAADKELPSMVPGARSWSDTLDRTPPRIRIAYISGDFRTHPVAQLLAGLIESHDRERFEIIGVSIGPSDGSAMRHRLEHAFDRFEDMDLQSAQKVADRVQALKVDIAVDLVGHTAFAKSQAFVHRMAPVQVNFLGFPGTMGGNAHDYIIVDPFIATDDLRSNAYEKLAILPDCYLPNDYRAQIAQAHPTRSDEGLPDGSIVFCCFNQASKITPPTFDVWMRILRQVDDSVLWLSRSGERCIANLRAEAARRGVNPDRLILAKFHRALDQHLARISLADLFLDTFPYTAHTTASDALWAGCPIVTMAGNSFASRVCGSLLHVTGLPELVTYSWRDYEALALHLVRQPGDLQAIRARLAANRLTSALFDTQRFARNIERAYEEMMRRHQMKMVPAEIDVRLLA